MVDAKANFLTVRPKNQPDPLQSIAPIHMSISSKTASEMSKHNDKLLSAVSR